MRAAAFRLPKPQLQFIIVRGALRMLLGRYLGISADECCFAFTEFGKPFLQEPSTDLRFNVTHSGDQALIAIARSAEIGIDIEQHRKLDDAHGLAKMILSADDMERWLSVPETLRISAFYAAWTRKEAVAKAVGQGLSMDFPALRVSFEPGRDAALEKIGEPWGPLNEWTLKSLDAVLGYSAAVAARVPRLHVLQRILPIDDLFAIGRLG